MLTPCILTMSCKADRDGNNNDVVRGTYLREWGHLMPHRFVLGAGNEGAGLGEWIVDAPDDYGSLQMKQRAAYKRAIAEGVSHAFICFTDTYIHIPRLVDEFYSRSHLYVGRKVVQDYWASGGAGYWLGPEALEFCATAPNQHHMQGDEWDGRWLADHGINLLNDERYGTTITRHLSPFTGGYRPLMMAAAHRELRDVD